VDKFDTGFHAEAILEENKRQNAEFIQKNEDKQRVRPQIRSSVSTVRGVELIKLKEKVD
jgi:hypothetical protein